MQTIELEVKDEIFYNVGLQSIKERLQKELEYLYFEFLALNIQKKINESDINNDFELEKAREINWLKIKNEFINVQ